MAKLIYAAMTSLDGFVADESGNFDWIVPDEEMQAFINSRERQKGTYLFGRKSGARSAGHSSRPCGRISPPHRADHRGQRQSLSKRSLTGIPDSLRPRPGC